MKNWILLCAVLLSVAVRATQETPGPLQVPSPDWRDQVIYFVLTDRFADGNPANNDQGSAEYNPQSSSHFSGGDLQGLRSRLDYIQQLGATAVWLTPPVANQWWSQQAQYGGYHGYWAVDFLNVDKHLGSLADYQALSRDLHGRGMYLVQDIVVNHTGNFFAYQGPYDPSNSAKHFTLSEPAGSRFTAPTQAPFQLINRLDPAQQRAAIYHWTPPIADPSIPAQEFSYQVGTLADLNTSNPQVRQALKYSYRYWLEAAGVDAYRIDTAKYVEHEFWHDFLHATDGVLAKAKALGKEDFLAFGEVFEASAPYSNAGEHKLQRFLGSADKPELNSVIAFPLYFELNRVLAEGQPPAQLGYRLAQHTALFGGGHRLPTFVNNHDTNRFLSAGSAAALLQAYAVLFTVPGIPVIYQGDEQLLTQSRQAMFAGGWGSGGRDWFDQQSPLYRQLQSLATLRRQYPVLSRGDWQLLQADQHGPGVLAYQMQQGAQRFVMVLNTADRPHLMADLPLQRGLVRWSNGIRAIPTTLQGQHGRLSMLLPARAVLVMEETVLVASAPAPDVTLSHSAAPLELPPVPVKPLTSDYLLSGHGPAQQQLLVVLNGDPNRLPPLQTDADGHFSLRIPVRDLGHYPQLLQLFSPDRQAEGSALQTGQLLASWPYFSLVDTPTIRAQWTDPRGDDHGPDGSYQQPRQRHSQQQLDILGVAAKAAGATLELTLQMAQVSQFWGPANGFDNVHLALFFDIPALRCSKLSQQSAAEPVLLPVSQKEAQALPGLQHQMPAAGRWQLGHYLFGWGNALFTAEGADAHRTGSKLTGAPSIRTNPAAGTITLTYQGRAFGVDDWAGSQIYLSTWDKSGEGQLRALQSEPGDWHFSARDPQGPKVLDDLLLSLPAKQPDLRCVN